MSNVTIFPSVTENGGIEDGKSVTEWAHVTAGTTSSAGDALLLMTGGFLLLFNGNNLGLLT